MQNEMMTLFVSAFISSTIAPGGSEAVLAYMVSEHKIQVPVLIIVATVGNTLGAITTWFLGVITEKKYPVEAVLSKKKLKAIDTVRKWGRWTLLFSWLPIVGDAFCFAAGWLKFSMLSSLILIFVGKLTRYAFIAWMFT